MGRHPARYRLRPVYARLSSQLDRYQEVVEPLRRLAMWGIPIFFGFFAGFAASAQWETTWLWFNGVPTSTTDPQFGLDTGFYLFGLPFYTSVLGFASAVVLVCLLLTAVVSYLYGSVRVGQRELRISKAARIQLAILAGLYLLLQGASLWLDRFTTLINQEDRITGPGYVGVNASSPVRRSSRSRPSSSPGLLRHGVHRSLALPADRDGAARRLGDRRGRGHPLGGQHLPGASEPARLESQYYQRNIDSTKAAYGIDNVEKENFERRRRRRRAQLRNDAASTAQLRIMDPAIISPTVRQLEQYRAYYQFGNPLDVDRYEINGQSQDTVVALRDSTSVSWGMPRPGRTPRSCTRTGTHGRRGR